MIPTIYPTLFLNFEFSSDFKTFDITKCHKIGPKFVRGKLVSRNDSEWLYPEPFNIDDIIVKYYPEVAI